MIDFLFEKVIYLYFSWWSLWKYVQKQHIESTYIVWNKFLMWHSNKTNTQIRKKKYPIPKYDHTEYTYHIHIAFSILFWYTQYEFVMYKLLHMTYYAYEIILKIPLIHLNDVIWSPKSYIISLTHVEFGSKHDLMLYIVLWQRMASSAGASFINRHLHSQLWLSNYILIKQWDVIIPAPTSVMV